MLNNNVKASNVYMRVMRVYARMCVYMCIYPCVCVYIYICIYVYMDVYAYILTRTLGCQDGLASSAFLVWLNVIGRDSASF